MRKLCLICVNTSWIVCVSVYIYMFLSVLCFYSECLAQGLGKSITIKTLLESFPTTSEPMPQIFQLCPPPTLCEIPKDGSWDIFGL